MTARHVRRVYNETGYLMCPHTAVGHLGMQAYREMHEGDATFITVGTAHPAKFADSIERIIGEDVPLPPALAEAMAKHKRVKTIKPELSALSKQIETVLG